MDHVHDQFRISVSLAEHELVGPGAAEQALFGLQVDRDSIRRAPVQLQHTHTLGQNRTQTNEN